jgi:sugar/nucleoside kinase (ribokinase family)
MGEHDLVVVTDYGHGLFDPQTMAVVQEHAPFLALNCQTNSANYGFNLITKYRRADTFSLDQRELSLAFGVQDVHENQSLLLRLREQLGASSAWLTLGADGSLGVTHEGEVERTPALTLHVRDTLGAGDAFFALASASAYAGQTLAIGSFLGALAGALAANITGNERAVDKVDLLKFASTVLNV